MKYNFLREISGPPFILTPPFIRHLRVANFADIIKVATMFIKATFKDSKKLKELAIMY